MDNQYFYMESLNMETGPAEGSELCTLNRRVSDGVNLQITLRVSLTQVLLWVKVLIEG